MRRRENQGLLISHRFITIFFQKQITNRRNSFLITNISFFGAWEGQNGFSWTESIPTGIKETFRTGISSMSSKDELRSSLEFLTCLDNLSHTSHGTRNAWERVNCCSLFASSAWVVEVVRWIAWLPQDWEVLGLSPASSISYSRFNQSLVFGGAQIRNWIEKITLSHKCITMKFC